MKDICLDKHTELSENQNRDLAISLSAGLGDGTLQVDGKYRQERRKRL
jgi:hypothetical protein